MKSSRAFLGLALTVLTGFSQAPWQAAWAGAGGGGGVGNGGGAWTCRENTAEGKLIWIKLVDLSEVEREYGEVVPPQTPMPGRVLSPQDWLASNDPYLGWAELKLSIAAKSNPLSKAFYAEYLRRKLDLVTNRILVPSNSAFDHTPDVLHHTRPADATCPNGHILQEPEQLANFTTLGKLEINPALWYEPALSDVDRAALFVHELIYWIYRDFGHDTDSMRTRVVVGYLFAKDKPIEEYASMINLLPHPPGDSPLLYGRFGEITGHWMDMNIVSYDAITHRIVLNQEDRDHRWKVTSTSTLQCASHGSEYKCSTVLSTHGNAQDWATQYIRIIDPNNFVWVKLWRNGSIRRATHYSKEP